jgi:hypothetical protein
MKKTSILQRLALLLFTLSTLVILFYTEENWRGAKIWAECKARLESQGESFNIESFIPAAVPPEQNFCSLPLFANLGSTQYDAAKKIYIANNSSAIETLNSIGLRDSHAKKPLPLPMPTDNSFSWKEYYLSNPSFAQKHPNVTEAQALLLRFSEHADMWKELEAATLRPYSHFPVNYQVEPSCLIDVDHLDGTHDFVVACALKANAEFESGQSAQGLKTLKIYFKLRQAIGEEPRLLPIMLGATMTAIVLKPIQKALELHCLNNAELAELSSEISKIDYLKEYNFSIRGEIYIIFIRTLDYIKTNGYSALRRLDRTDSIPTTKNSLSQILTSFIRSLMPGGWIDINKAYAADYYHKYDFNSVDSTQHRYYPEKRDVAIKAYSQIPPFSPKRIYAQPACHYIPQNKDILMEIQTQLDLARIACSLESYYLAHHSYPQSLRILPDNQPKDIFTGQDYLYERTSNGRFRLWSAGRNQSNDRGKWILRKQNDNSIEDSGDDIVWNYKQSL